MKKFIASVLALSLVVSLPATAFGESETKKTNITTEIQPTYVVEVPKDTKVNFKDTETYFGKVQVKEAQIELNEYITVSLDTDGSLKNSTDPTKVLPYTITDASGSKFTANKYDKKGQSTDLTINITEDDWNAAYAGSYSGTVTFNISYGE